MTIIAEVCELKGWFKAITATCSWSSAWWHWRFPAYWVWLFALRDYKVYHSQNWFDVLWLQQLFVMWPGNWTIQVTVSTELPSHLWIATKCTHTNWQRGAMIKYMHITLITQASPLCDDRHTEVSLHSLLWRGQWHSTIKVSTPNNVDGFVVVVIILCLFLCVCICVCACHGQL